VRGDRTRVDHGVERASGSCFEGDLVEGLPGRFDTDLGQDGVEAAIGQGQRVGERLGDRLDGERDLGVADAVDLPVDVAKAAPRRSGSPDASSGM
jgi:hypothetical protein